VRYSFSLVVFIKSPPRSFPGCPDDGAVTLAQFASFWDEWFSKIVRDLRYKKRLLALWNLYLLVGFINKDQLKQIMDQQKV
jgi:hypothetical protein